MTLKVSRLSRKLPSGVLFENLSFVVERGQTLVVMGASGSGKSSLLRCLAWLDPIDAGELALDGRSPTMWGASAWRTQVCYVAQTPPPLRGTAAAFAERIQQFERQRGRSSEQPEELSRHWGIDESVWQRPFSELSGGERQRVMLALAVSRKPSLLLLDEPTSAVDDAGVAIVEASLRGLTKVWVTHDEAQALRVADQRLRLEHHYGDAPLGAERP